MLGLERGRKAPTGEAEREVGEAFSPCILLDVILPFVEQKLRDFNPTHWVFRLLLVKNETLYVDLVSCKPAKVSYI